MAMWWEHTSRWAHGLRVGGRAAGKGQAEVVASLRPFPFEARLDPFACGSDLLGHAPPPEAQGRTGTLSPTRLSAASLP